MKTRRVVCMALASRALVLLAMAIWAAMGKPYDTSAALDLPCLSQNASSRSKPEVLESALARSVVWDGVYYLRIARCGYEYEQMHAFQPLLPLLMRFTARTIFSGLEPLLGYYDTLALAGYTINFWAFIFAAFYLYKLSYYILEDDTLAYLSAAFFCFNPASVFYSSIYTESLFALFTFAGMWYFVRGFKWTSAVLFGLSSIARSNGVLHAGFFLFQALHVVAQRFSERRILSAGSFLLQTAMQVACVSAPFLSFQAYGYYQLCFEDRHSRPWCSSTMPYLYGFVQSYYWEVGFLRYFQVKQIPNFLSASPALLLASSAILTYAKTQTTFFFSAGLAAPFPERRKAALFPKFTKSEDVAQCSGRPGRKYILRNNNYLGFFSAATVSFVLELLFMTAVAFFVMHVQVSTRFLSSSPVTYWFPAHIRKDNNVFYLLRSVFLVYIMVGTLLFVNFYPFT